MDLSAASHLHQLDLASRSASRHTLLQYDMVQRRYATWCRERFGHATIYDLTQANLRDFLAWLREEHIGPDGERVSHGQRSLGSHLLALKALSTFLFKAGSFPRGDPFSHVHVPKPKQQEMPRFTIKEIERMLRLSATTVYPLRNKAMLGFLYETGVRVQELCDLATPEITLARGKDNGRALIHGKGAKTRHVYFGVKCSLALSLYLNGKERPDERGPWLFLSRTGGQCSRALVDHVIKDIGTLAGVEATRVSAHTFRHTFATNYLKANPGQLVQLQRLLGHSTSTQTLHYARLAQEDVAGSYRSLLDGLS